MTERHKQTWHLEIGRIGQSCKVFCDGVCLMNVQSADLHLKAGEISTLVLQFAEYGHPTPPLTENPEFREGDEVTATGIPMFSYINIDGKRYRLIEVKTGEHEEDGLFGPVKGTKNQRLVMKPLDAEIRLEWIATT